jgi:hypothetical protein
LVFSWCFLITCICSIVNETPSLRGCIRLDIGEALRYYRNDTTVQVRYAVLRVGLSVVVYD